MKAEMGDNTKIYLDRSFKNGNHRHAYGLLGLEVSNGYMRVSGGKHAGYDKNTDALFRIYRLPVPVYLLLPMYKAFFYRWKVYLVQSTS